MTRTKLLAIVESARNIPPAGAATIFAIAWIAGFAGSLAALLIAAALFAGLFAAARAAVIPPAIVASLPSTIVVDAAPQVIAAPSSPLADALAAGLSIRKIEFAGPQSARVKVKA